MKRCLLHKSKLEDFKSFLIKEQFQYRSGKGQFQVLQVEVRGAWIPIYDRLGGDHFTTQKELIPLIRTYLRERNEHSN